MSPDRIVDQTFMEKFFRDHLALFDATALIDLRIWRHDPALVFHNGVILVKYELDAQKSNGTRETIVLRGSTGPDERRQKAYHILNELWHSGFDRGPHIVPQPIGYFTPLRLLLYRNIEGLSLMQHFESGHDHYAEKIKAAVEWLLQFHRRKPLRFPEVGFSWPRQDQEFQQMVRTICEKYQAHAARIRRVSQFLLEQEKKLLRRETFTLVHGDYQPNNIITASKAVAVIDFNDALLYDELFDLAYFLTQTESMLRRLRHVDLGTLPYELEQRYFTARRLPYDERARKKLALFRAKTLLSIKAVTGPQEGLKILEEIETNAEKTT